MTKDEASQQIEKELATATYARSTGNDGMMRVCARRAAGVAIAYWLQSHPEKRWGVDAMNQLHSLSRDTAIPEIARGAATRLTARITQQFHSPFSTDPIDDANIIINFFLENQ
jgi:hypothetical protein